MSLSLRNRKRVFAEFQRAPDGSAFQKCESCGVSMAVALADMHVCEGKIKRSKPQFQKTVICKVDKVEQQPRSPFLFFREKFATALEDEDIVGIDKRACRVWKSMSLTEQHPYVCLSDMVDRAYNKALLQENKGLEQDDDEADSKKCFQKGNLHDNDNCTSSSDDTSFSDDDDNIFY